MAVRKQFESIVHARLEEAERFLQMLGAEEVAFLQEEERFLEWKSVTDDVLLFAFGELSRHTRSFRTVVELVQMERGLYINRLSACVRRAKLEIVSSGMHNPERELPEGWELPDYPCNQAAQKLRRRKRDWWRWFW